MPIDQALKELTDRRDELQARYDEVAEAGANEVSVGGISTRRINLETLRRQINDCEAKIYQHRVRKGGGSVLGGVVQYIRPGDGVYGDS